MESEKALLDNLQHSAIGTMDNHLVEFTEELRTVAKALQQAADGKARAQEEATEWKRKYEIEKQWNFQLQRKEISVQEDIATDATLKWIDYSSHQAENGESVQSQNGKCFTKYGICSEEVLPRQISQCDFVMGSNLCTSKASFTLAWGSNGESNRQHKHDVVSFESGNITTATRSHKQITLKWNSPPQSVVILTKPNSNSVRVLCAEMIRWLVDKKKVTIFVEPRVKNDLLAESMDFRFVQSWEKDEEVLLLHTKVDLVITLGGDGTVLWASSLFKGPVPPVISFSLGSLGFMTPFQSDCYRDCLEMIMRGPVSITLRHRLQCQVLRDAGFDERLGGEPILVLNEVTIDRGMSSFLTYLECYCDDSFVTCVQGDGLILSTTSGSTAYSLAAGGSMVHPQVPGILFTPICPHSLSFRPLILPEYVTIRVQVPFNSRGKAWASFDGKDRKELKPGDALICTHSYPLPTIFHNTLNIIMSDEKNAMASQPGPAYTHIPSQKPPEYTQASNFQPGPTIFTAAPSTVVVLPHPIDVFHLEDRPAVVVCPHCGQTVLTETSFHSGGGTFLSAAGLLMLGTGPLALAPFFIRSVKDIVHTCPACQRRIVKKKRMGGRKIYISDKAYCQHHRDGRRCSF